MTYRLTKCRSVSYCVWQNHTASEDEFDIRGLFDKLRHHRESTDPRSDQSATSSDAEEDDKVTKSLVKDTSNSDQEPEDDNSDTSNSEQELEEDEGNASNSEQEQWSHQRILQK